MRRPVFAYPLIALVLSFPFAVPLHSQDREMKETANTLSQFLAKSGKGPVAVVDFTDSQQNVTYLGQYVAAELEVDLVNSGAGLSLIDRTRLKTILQENKLGDLLDPATVRQLGKFSGVQVLIIGTLTPIGDDVHLTVKAEDTETAQIETALAIDIPKTPRIQEQINLGLAKSPSSAGPIAQPGPSGTLLPSASANSEVEKEQFAFTLNSCELSGAEMTCDLTLKNLADKRDLEIFGNPWKGGLRSRLIDEDNREAVPDYVTLGSKESSIHQGLEATIVPGTKARVLLHFDKMPSDITAIASLEIGCQVNNKEFSVEFSNVSVFKRR